MISLSSLNIKIASFLRKVFTVQVKIRGYKYDLFIYLHSMYILHIYLEITGKKNKRKQKKKIKLGKES